MPRYNHPGLAYGQTPSYDQPITPPAINPIDLLAGSLSGGLTSLLSRLAPETVRSLTPEIVAPLARAARPYISGYLESPTTETTGHEIYTDAATNLQRYAMYGDRLLRDPASLRRAYQGPLENYADNFGSYAKDVASSPFEYLQRHLENYSKLARQAAEDTGTRPYAEHALRVFRRALKEADKITGYESS